ncbi:MAG: tRNA uridine-5-carboxymethylaminomethyl(34) synthesis enzyme MnmG, partial [Pseudomonadota bacterium]|nr:tRNA uridine-5-carboxymethylaminomethyl(34) synthesis enzyme MnmG [Pseudomonadota bacterium]
HAAVSRETLRSELGVATADAVIEQVQTGIKYAGYVAKQNAAVARAALDEDLALPADIDYAHVRALSFEVRQTLGRQRPASLGHAARLPGMTPAAVSLLRVFLKKRRQAARSATAATTDDTVT